MESKKHSARPRFTLWGLLLMVTLIAMSLALFMAYRELVPLRREVRRLRDQAGILSVDDPTELHAILVETFTPHVWKWRLWIPANNAYKLRFAAKEIPNRDKFRDLSGALNLPANPNGREITILASIQKLPNGELRLAVQSGSVTAYEQIEPQNAKWILARSAGWSSDGVGRSTRVGFGADANFLLLRHRVFYVGGGSIPPTPEPETTDGVLVWLEEQ